MAFILANGILPERNKTFGENGVTSIRILEAKIYTKAIRKERAFSFFWVVVVGFFFLVFCVGGLFGGGVVIWHVGSVSENVKKIIEKNGS